MSYPSNINFIGSQANFIKQVKTLYEQMFNNTENTIDDKRNINNMFGFDSGIVPESNPNIDINVKLSFSNLVQFYGFWGSDNSVNLSKTYISSIKDSSKGSSQNEVQNTQSMENYNYVATYILFIFFNNQIVNLSNSTENSFLPDINNQQNSPKFTKAILNLKNFISESSGQNTSLLGAGNYNISTKEQNRGFVYSMCINDIYKFFTEKNKFLIESDQTLSNSPDIYTQLTDKQISFYRKELSKNPNLANWCGCFAPIPKFLQDQKTSNFNTQGDSPCDPLCYNQNNIGLYDITNTGPGNGETPRIACNADICVIDNISIESFGETGEINFNQVCTGCKTQNKNCLCFLDVSTPNLVNKISSGPNAMANQINYVQNCPNSICFKIDDTTGSENIVECNRFDIPSSASLDGLLFLDGLSGKQYPQRITNSIWFVLILSLFLFIIYQPKIFFNI